MKKVKTTALALSLLLSSTISLPVQVLPCTAQEKTEFQSINTGKEAFANAISASRNVTSVTAGVQIESVRYQQQASYALVELDGDLYTVNGAMVSIEISSIAGYTIDSASLNGFSAGPTETINPTVSLQSSPGKVSYSFDLQKNPLSTITVNWKDKAEEIYTTYYLIQAQDVDLEGLYQPELDLSISRDGSSAMLFLEPEDVAKFGTSASYQWRRLPLLMDFDDPISSANGFEMAAANSAAPYSYLIIPDSSNLSQGYAYQLEVSSNGQSFYSDVKIIPVENDFENERPFYSLDLSQSSLIQNSEQLLQALGIFMKYQPKNADGTMAVRFEEADVYGSNPSALFDLKKLSIPGTYNLRLISTGNGIYAEEYHDLVLTITGSSITPETPGQTPSNPSNPSNPSIPMQPEGSVSPFKDIPLGQWFSESVLEADRLGLMHGSNGYFRPNEALKRGDLALILYRLAGEPDWKRLGAPLPQYADVYESEYYYNAIMWASIMNVITGYRTDNPYKPEFRPKNPITRQELVTMLGRYAENVAQNSVGANPSDYAAYPDADTVASYASNYMAWAIANKILNGKLLNGSYYLCVNEAANRDQAAKMLVDFNTILK